MVRGESGYFRYLAEIAGLQGADASPGWFRLALRAQPHPWMSRVPARRGARLLTPRRLAVASSSYFQVPSNCKRSAAYTHFPVQQNINSVDMVGIPLYLRASRRHPDLPDRLHGISARKFFRAAAKNFILLQLLFLCLFSYIFGALFQQGERTHNMTIAFVDYDGGAIGAAVRQAYVSMQGAQFPTLVERSTVDFAAPSELESAVCRTEYWAGLYIVSGASRQLHSALRSEIPSFDRRNVLAFIWNEARYSTLVDQAIASNLVALSSAARVAYSTANGTGDVRSILSAGNMTADAISLLSDPWELVSIDMQPTPQGSRAIYNTVAIILIMIQEFFYLSIVNGLHHNFDVYTKLHPTRIIIYRSLNSLAYCFVGSLSLAGAIWAFRSGWHVGGAQFVLTWMSLWLFAHINFQALDVLSIWLPLPYVPMALITWLILNVTSIISPFDLSAAWYRVGYALPAHATYQVLVDIWSRGCNPQLHYALPVLCAWELIASVWATMGVYRRSHYAALAEVAAQKQFAERLDAAIEFQRKREKEMRDEEKRQEQVGKRNSEVQAETDVEQRGDSMCMEKCRDEERLRKEIAEVMEREDHQIMQENRRRGSKTSTSFGPTFSLPFGRDGDGVDG